MIVSFILSLSFSFVLIQTIPIHGKNLDSVSDHLQDEEGNFLPNQILPLIEFLIQKSSPVLVCIYTTVLIYCLALGQNIELGILFIVSPVIAFLFYQLFSRFNQFPFLFDESLTTRFIQILLLFIWFVYHMNVLTDAINYLL